MQLSLTQKVEELTNEFARLAGEIRRDVLAIQQEIPNANPPPVRRGVPKGQ